MVERAGILEQSIKDRNRVGIGLSYRLDRLHRLAESISWNRFLGSLKVKNNVSDTERVMNKRSNMLPNLTFRGLEQIYDDCVLRFQT